MSSLPAGVGAKVRVAVVGLGEIGQATARAVAEEPGLTLVGVADRDLTRRPRPLGSRVVFARNLEEICDRTGPDVAVLTTSSRLADVLPDLHVAARASVDVVSSCEELSCPDLVDPAGTAELRRLAHANGITILGTGVNPGFALDRWLLTLACASCHVRRLFAERVVDLDKRRSKLKIKAGVGLTRNQFEDGLLDGRLGHVGMRQSATLVARGMGWPASEIREECKPIVNSAGRLSGIRCAAFLGSGRKPQLELRLTLAMGAKPKDVVEVDGDPPLRVEISGGMPGDDVTVATLVRGVWAVRRSQPGLLSPADLRAWPLPPDPRAPHGHAPAI